ncbi:hypothetical protein BHM03_00025748, partial [Ensete ventricosum]
VSCRCLRARVVNLRMRLESIADSCKKVKSCGVPDVTPPMVKLVRLRNFLPPCSVEVEACALPAAVVMRRPYLCQVGRTAADSSMLVSGRLRCVGSATLEVWSSKGTGSWQSGHSLLYHNGARRRAPGRAPQSTSTPEPSTSDMSLRFLCGGSNDKVIFSLTLAKKYES